MLWFRHSRLIEPINRSAYPFCQGLWCAVSTSSTPSDSSCRRTLLSYTRSRSRIRYRGASRSANASTSCRAVHSAVGCSLTLKCNFAPPGHQHDENKQHLPCDRLHGEEVDRNHLPEVILQKRLPRPGASVGGRSKECGRRCAPRFRSRASSVRRECAVRARVDRQRPFGESTGGSQQLSWVCPFRAAVPRKTCPELAEPLAMPPNHGIRLDEHQRAPPTAPKLTQTDPVRSKYSKAPETLGLQ